MRLDQLRSSKRAFLRRQLFTLILSRDKEMAYGEELSRRTRAGVGSHQQLEHAKPKVFE